MVSPESAMLTAVGGATTGAVGLANFVYTLIKDHGAKLTTTKEAGGEGVASGAFDDTKFTSEFEGEYRAAGIWYTHTRAFGSLLSQHRGTLPHEKTGEPGEFSSAYLCTIFPYELRWNLYKVTPKAISESDQAEKRLELTKRTTAAYQAFDAGIESMGFSSTTLAVKIGNERVEFRKKRPTERFTAYIKFLEQFAAQQPRLKALINELKAELDAVTTQEETLAAQLEKINTAEPFYVMRNIMLQERTDLDGIRQHFWQHLTIESKFIITPRREKPYGFSVSLVWGEKALGYGYPGHAGDFEITQSLPGDTNVIIDANGSKLGKRFDQFKKVTKKR